MSELVCAKRLSTQFVMYPFVIKSSSPSQDQFCPKGSDMNGTNRADQDRSAKSLRSWSAVFAATFLCKTKWTCPSLKMESST